MLLLMLLLLATPYDTATQAAMRLATVFRQQVDHRINVPVAEQHRYATLLEQALTEAQLGDLPAQYVVLVDRNAFVQAAMIYWKSESGEFQFIGASQASTGQPGRFEHFETPLGVFPHTLENPDFRAEGTLNEFGLLGYGPKGSRIYDFGWVKATKGWGDGRQSVMRLQLHSTVSRTARASLGQYLVHMFERDCSVQRRHQKLIEESPAPAVDAELRERIGKIGTEAARAVGYRSAGTIEGLLAGRRVLLPRDEHARAGRALRDRAGHRDGHRAGADPVAAGEELSFNQEDITFRGHAIECRINAEDASKNFAPAPGSIGSYREPGGPFVRVDSGVEEGYEVLPSTTR